MKKLLFASLLALSFVATGYSQLSAKAGLVSTRVKVDYDGPGSELFGSASDSELGFFFGAGYDILLNDDAPFELHLAALFALVSDLNALQIPLEFQYEIIDGLSAIGGPQINMILSDLNDVAGSLGVDLGLGAQYDIDDTWYVFAAYYFQVLRGDGDVEDLSYNISNFRIGVGYRFLD